MPSLPKSPSTPAGTIAMESGGRRVRVPELELREELRPHLSPEWARHADEHGDQAWIRLVLLVDAHSFLAQPRIAEKIMVAQTIGQLSLSLRGLAVDGPGELGEVVVARRRRVPAQRHHQFHFVVQVTGAGRVGHAAVDHDGIGGLEEERRRAAIGLRGRRGGAHLARMVGEVAADAVHPPYGETAFGSNYRQRRANRRNEYVFHLQFQGNRSPRTVTYFCRHCMNGLPCTANLPMI